MVEGTNKMFVLGVARDDHSRGGSVFIHDQLKQGDIISLSSISQGLAINFQGSNYIFIVGGVGITAFLGMMRRLTFMNCSFHLHYAVREAAEVAFKSILEEFGDAVTVYDRSKGERMDIAHIVKSRKWNSHVYICGPQRMIDAVVTAAEADGMSSDEVFYEKFSAEVGGDPFTAEVVSKERTATVEVPEDKSLLEVIREAGFEVGSSCEVGSCGTCRIGLKAGKVEHRGTGLTEEEKEGEMLACVSRGVGKIVVELPEEV